LQNNLDIENYLDYFKLFKSAVWENIA